jgi:hypothetical protein
MHGPRAFNSGILPAAANIPAGSPNLYTIDSSISAHTAPRGANACSYRTGAAFSSVDAMLVFLPLVHYGHPMLIPGLKGLVLTIDLARPLAKAFLAIICRYG